MRPSAALLLTLALVVVLGSVLWWPPSPRRQSDSLENPNMTSVELEESTVPGTPTTLVLRYWPRVGCFYALPKRGSWTSDPVQIEDGQALEVDLVLPSSEGEG
jgi:hypothetical protein